MPIYDVRSISQVGTTEPFELQVARGQIPGHRFVPRLADVPVMSNNTTGTVWDVDVRASVRTNNARVTAAYDLILIQERGPL